VETVVFTADRGRSTSRSSSSNTSDWVAVETNGGTNVLNDHVHESESLDGIGREVILVLDCVAALDGTSGAVSTSTTLGRGGSHEGEEGSSSEDDGFGEHGCCEVGEGGSCRSLER
jgi:hypothetical protein